MNSVTSCSFQAGLDVSLMKADLVCTLTIKGSILSGDRSSELPVPEEHIDWVGASVP